jgi:hypothetical protein
MKNTGSTVSVSKRAHAVARSRRSILFAAAILAIALAFFITPSRLGEFSYLVNLSAPAALSASTARFADFVTEMPSPEARHVGDWVADSRDSAGNDFVIVDKKYARIYVFDGEARLRGSAPILLGAAVGDDSVPGIGLRPISEVLPEERTTPAGRFVAERGHNTRGEDVVWVDYDDAVSIHRVLTTNADERRLERLSTAAVDDNRISYGCINVPAAFYETYIRPIFSVRRAIVYVLPDVKPVQQVFGSYDVAAKHAGVKPPSVFRPPN